MHYEQIFDVVIKDVLLHQMKTRRHEYKMSDQESEKKFQKEQAGSNERPTIVMPAWGKCWVIYISLKLRPCSACMKPQ